VARLPCSRNDTKSGPRVRATAARNGLAGAFCRMLAPGGGGGSVRVGDTLELRERPHPQWTLQKVSALVYGGELGEKYPYRAERRKPITEEEREALRELLACPELAQCEWKDMIAEILHTC